MIPQAQTNFERLRNNPYPGRGLVVGMDETGGALVQVYWIMGRSANSRNRVFESGEGGLLQTTPADASKTANPSLIIYNAMRELKGLYVVTNGDQTDTIIQAEERGANILEALDTRVYEPDAPNYTPRITGIWSLRHGPPLGGISIIKKSPFGMRCDRCLFFYEDMGPGYGRCVTTYQGDGAPLPSFEGEPLLMPLAGGAEAILDAYWQALNAENRISLAVKFIPISRAASTLVIRNQYKKC
ncbi:MAG: inosine monophosphate cyclohydrolase [Candidatus Sumerlaeota bacterium]|nr:inosine monophosphate cyclohydrolase [Candidatus Sumerlaeota bacterium]